MGSVQRSAQAASLASPANIRLGECNDVPTAVPVQVRGYLAVPWRRLDGDLQDHTPE